MAPHNSIAPITLEWKDIEHLARGKNQAEKFRHDITYHRSTSTPQTNISCFSRRLISRPFSATEAYMSAHFMRAAANKIEWSKIGVHNKMRQKQPPSERSHLTCGQLQQQLLTGYYYCCTASEVEGCSSWWDEWGYRVRQTAVVCTQKRLTRCLRVYSKLVASDTKLVKTLTTCNGSRAQWLYITDEAMAFRAAY